MNLRAGLSGEVDFALRWASEGVRAKSSYPRGGALRRTQYLLSVWQSFICTASALFPLRSCGTRTFLAHIVRQGLVTNVKRPDALLPENAPGLPKLLDAGRKGLGRFSNA